MEVKRSKEFATVHRDGESDYRLRIYKDPSGFRYVYPLSGWCVSLLWFASHLSGAVVTISK